MQRAVNPQTGEVLFLVDNKWTPPAQTAKNDAGDTAYLVGNRWEVVKNARLPEPILSPEEQAIGGAAPEVGLPPTPVSQSVNPNSMTADEYRAQVAAREAKGYDRTLGGSVIDSGVTLLKGAIGLPEAFVGLADIPTLGYAGKILEEAGYRPKEAKAILDTYLSEAQQYANRQVKETKGFLPTIGAALQNPSTIVTAVGESLPQMIGGAGVARGILKGAPGLSPYLAGAAGEGLLGAGAAAEQIRQGTEDKLLTGKQALSAVGSGVGTAAFGVAGGKLAKKFGFDDIDTLLVGGGAQTGSKSVKDFAKRATASGISEGVFEEMPQSAQETMWMNYATDKPLLEGVPEAAGMGLVTGATMGVGATAAGGRRKQAPQTPTPTEAAAPIAPEVAPIVPIAPEVTPEVAPPSASQDTDAMLQELLAPTISVKEVELTPNLQEEEAAEKKPAPAIEAPAAEAPKEEAPAEPTLKEQYDNAAKLNFIAPDAFRDRRITQEQYDGIKSNYERLKAEYQASIPKTELNPIQQEATDIADKLEALGQKPFVTGMRAAIEKNRVNEQNLEFYRTKLKQEQAKQGTLEEGIERPSEKFEWTDFYRDEPKGLEKLKLFNSKAPPAVKQALQTVTDTLQALTNRLNDEGYTMYGAPSSSVPQDIKNLRSQIQMRSAGGVKLINAFEALNKGFNRSKKTTNKENLDAAIQDIKVDAAEAQKVLQRSIPEPQEVVEARGALSQAGKQIDELTYKSGSLWSALAGKLDPEEVREIFGRNPSLGNKKLQVTKKSGKRGTYITELAADGLLDPFLPPAMRHESSRFDAAESAQYIKDLVGNKEYLPYDVKEEIKNIQEGVEPFGDLIDEYLTIEEQNRELQIAFDEQREADQAAEIVEPEGEDRAAEPSERPAGELELTAPTKDELKSKQDEIDRLSKENERLSKEAERKAKADEEAKDFVLTGSKREADQAAARGQKDIFAEAPAEEAPKDSKQEIADLKKEQKALMLQIIKAGLEETPEQEARMAEIDKRLRELEGKPAVQKEEKPVVKQRSVEEIQDELQDLEDQLDLELNKEKRKSLVSEISKLQGELTAAEGRAARAAAEEKPAEEAEEPSFEVETPEGNTLSYPAAYGLVNNGYTVLALNDPRTYTDKGGTQHRTFEKDGARIAVSPNQVLFEWKGRVQYGMGNPNELTLEMLAVDPKDRGKGKGTQVLKDLTKVADQYGITLYGEPVPIVNLKQKDVGLDFDQLVNLYKKFDFKFQETDSGVSERVIVRQPEAEVLPAEEPQIAGQVGFEPYTIEGDFTEVAEEQQRLMLEDQTENLSDAQVSTLEKHYGAKADSDEFFTKLREDVSNFIVKGATAVNGKIRAIIRQLANGVLAVGIAFNPQYMSQPLNVMMPVDNVRTEEVLATVPDAATDKMSEPAKRAFAVIYPALQEQMVAKDKLFIMADKPSGRVFVFNPDGSLLLEKKSLFGLAKGDLYVGDNDKPQNRITPAGLFDLKFVDAAKGAAEKRTAGDYDTGTVLAINDPDGTITIMHSVWLKEKDAAQRAAALRNESPADSRYSFGCINVDAPTYSFLVNNHAKQMDGAALFIVPEAGVDVMSFITGKGAMSEDLARIKIKPVTKEVRTPQKQATQAEAKTKTPGREQQFFSLEKQTNTPAFKKFFGDSKVVDADGNPMIVYHATSDEFDSFDPSKDRRENGLIFFAEDPANAEATRFFDKREASHIMPVYLRIEKMFDGLKGVPKELQDWILSNKDSLEKELNEYEQDWGLAMSALDYLDKDDTGEFNPKNYIKAIAQGEWQAIEASKSLIKKIKELGYDGIKMYEDGNTYAVFNGNQVKSATGNRGTFDESGNINMSLEDDMVRLVNQIADSIADNEKKRSPSFKRTAKTLTRQRGEGKITDEEYLDRMNAAIEEDEESRLDKGVPQRVRGADFIREKLLNAKRRKMITAEGVDLAEWFIQQNPALVDDLGISVKGKGLAGVGGFYNSDARIINLIKDAGSSQTATHEILHHLERMMPTDIQNAIRKAWLTQLLKANKAAKDPAQRLYFMTLLDAHIGNNNHDRLEIPKDLEKIYKSAVKQMQFASALAGDPFGSSKSIDLAKNLLLYSPTVKNDLYEYFDPSEFWAVNGSDIVQARYEAVKGGVLAKLKNWLREFTQKIKSLLGLKSDASIIRALDSLAKSDGKFVTRKMLGTGEYRSIERRNYEGGEAPEPDMEIPEMSFMDNMIYNFGDKLIDTKRLIQSIQSTGRKINEQFDAYMKEENYHGRLAKRTKNFLNDEMRPVLEDMQERGVTLDELETFLLNRHAKEANAYIARINPTGFPEAGSSVSDAAADKYMAELTPEKRKDLMALAAKVDAIVKETQRVLVANGLETQETIDEWNATYKNYVPLQRDQLDFVHTGRGVMGGFATRGSASKRRVGSDKPVIDIFANIAMQRERALRRSEQARVGRALYGMAIKHPNPGFWLAINPDAIKDKDKLEAELISLGLTPEDARSIIQEPRQPMFDKKTGTVKYQVNPLLRNSPNVFPIRINGEDRFIFFNPNDPRALRMVESIKNLDTERLGDVIGTVGLVTRWFASVNTQYNIVFGGVNFLRDLGAASLNLSTTEIAGKEKQVRANVLPALRAIYRDLRGKGATTEAMAEMQDWFERFQMAGGQTGYQNQFAETKRKGNVVEQELKRLNRGNVKKSVDWLFDWLSDYNDAIENAVRLSAFKVAVESGLSEDKAASIAKNLTVNFNRKGARTGLISSLYAFFNAAIQGSARMVETLRGPMGKKIIYGGMFLGAMQAVILALSGFDDDEPPEFVKDKNLIIPIPFTDKKYLSVPMPLGFNMFPGFGRLAMEALLIETGMIRSRKGPGDKMMSAVSLVFDAFNPLGGSGNPLLMAVPTIGDPLAAIYSNRDAFGRPIYREDRGTAPTPGYERSRENASLFSKKLAEAINWATSPAGTQHTKGALSPTADQIDYFIGQITGGVGREIMKVGEFAKSKAVTQEEIPAYKLPIVGRFYGEAESPAATRSRFYENVKEMAKHEHEIKGLRKDKVSPTEYIKANPEARLWQRANNFENQVSKLNKEKRALLEKDAPREAVKRKEDEILKKMQQFNDQVRRGQ